MFYVENNEVVVICINAVTISSSYFYIFPKYVGFTLKDMAFASLIISSFSFLIIAYMYWGKEITFNALLFSTNWFWFSLIAYIAMELPFFDWYVKKYDVTF